MASTQVRRGRVTSAVTVKVAGALIVLAPGTSTTQRYWSPLSFAMVGKLMETLDGNGASFLVIVDAWRKIFRRQFWERHGGQ